MAESRGITHPWDHDHSEEGLQAVTENEIFQDALIDNGPQLSKKMKLSDTFWNLLILRGVVDERIKAQIQAAKTKRAQAMALVQHILNVEVYKLHGFVWALVNSNQCYIAELLGFSTDDFLDIEVFMMSSSFCCPACTEFYTKAYILTGCGHYICAPCAKGAQFICKDNKKEDITCPVPDCGKTSETTPSEGSLGLEEDVAFKDLCDVFVKRFSQKRECDKTNSENVELKDKNADKVKAQIAKLTQKAASLEKFKNTLGQQEATLKDHVREEQEKIKQSADDWAQKSLNVYAGIEHQVDKKLHQSLQWKKAASELSVFLRTQPWFSEIGQTMEDVLTKEADSPIPKENLMKDLDSGSSILQILSPYKFKDTSLKSFGAAETDKCGSEPGPSEAVPRPVKPDAGPAPPTKAKIVVESFIEASKLAWTPGGDLLILNSKGIHQLIVHTSTCKCTTSITQSWSSDMGCSSDGTLLLIRPISYQNGLPTERVIKVREYNGEEITMKPYIRNPLRIFINSSNIFVLGQSSRRVSRFNLNYQYVENFHIGLPYLPPITGYIHVTEKDTLLVSAPSEDRIYMMDLKTKTTSHFSSTGGKTDHLTSPVGVCSVNNGEHILACDTAKFLVEFAFPASKLAWTPDGDLLILNSEGIFQLVIHTSACKCTTLISQSGLSDMGCSPNGTLVLTQPQIYDKLYGSVSGPITVIDCNKGERRMKQTSISNPNRIFISSMNIYVLGESSRRVRKYKLDDQHVGDYDIGLPYLPPITGYIHITEKDTLLVSAPSEDRIYMMDLKTKTTSHFSSTGGKTDHLTSPVGVCSVNNGEHILACDTGNNRVCVFSHDGSYLHDLVIEKGSLKPTCIAVLARTGKPTLLALGMTSKTDKSSNQVIRVYSLD